MRIPPFRNTTVSISKDEDRSGITTSLIGDSGARNATNALASAVTVARIHPITHGPASERVFGCARTRAQGPGVRMGGIRTPE